MVTFLRRKYKPPLPLPPLKAPHTMTLLGCFTVLMMYLESYLETPKGLRTNLYSLRTSRDVLSSQNITILQSAIVQCLYILQNNILFFIMTLIILNNSWQSATWHFLIFLQTVLDSSNRHLLENVCMFFKDAVVTEGYIVTSCRISAPVLAVVFFLTPVTTFLGGVVPGGCLAAARFGHK